MCLGHTIVSSGPRLEETGVQGSHGIAAAACPAVRAGGLTRDISLQDARALRSLAPARPAQEAFPRDKTSCETRLRALDWPSAHPCMLPRIIHEDGSAVQRWLPVTPAGGFRRPASPDTAGLRSLQRPLNL
jgi:hypothetical protein